MDEDQLLQGLLSQLVDLMGADEFEGRKSSVLEFLGSPSGEPSLTLPPVALQEGCDLGICELSFKFDSFL
jgi:hypothetical protein